MDSVTQFYTLLGRGCLPDAYVDGRAHPRKITSPTPVRLLKMLQPQLRGLTASSCVVSHDHKRLKYVGALCCKGVLRLLLS